MSKQNKADLGLLLVAMIWGIGFIAVEKLLIYGYNPLFITGARFLIASLFLHIVFKDKVKFSKTNLQSGILIGIFLFLGFILQTYGQQFSTPSKTAFLTATNVVMVPFLYLIIFRQKVDLSGIIGAILTLIGVALLSLNESLQLGIGDLIVILGALAFALHITCVGRYAKINDPISLTVIQLYVASFLSLLLALLTNNVSLKLDGIGWLIYLGLFSSAIAFLLQNICQKNTTATKAAIILCLESVFGTIASVIIIKEVMSFRMILGSIIILLGVFVAELRIFSNKY